MLNFAKRFPPALALAAVKRGARSRARARPSSPATVNGTPVASFTLPSGVGISNPEDAARRTALLRRLNEITQQRSRLVRRATRDGVRDTVQNGSVADRVRGGVETVEMNGGKRRLANGVPKAGKEGHEGTDVDRQRNGRHIPHQRVDAVAKEPVAVDIPESKKVAVPSLDLKLVDLHSPKSPPKSSPKSSSKSLPKSTPPSTPAVGTRGSARVRTPSVLLKSHPGEKVPPLKPNAALKNRQVAYCLKFVKDMLRMKDGFAFSKPIDQLWSVDQLPGYFEMISTPMDLDTVRQRLESGHYMTSPGKDEVEEVKFDVTKFSVDVRLIFNNARTYNRPGDLFYEAATRLLEKFDSKIAKLPSVEQLAAQAAKKNKKRKKSQPPYASEGGKKAESTKRRKANDGESSSQPKSRPPAKKKTPAGTNRSKPKPPSASTGARKKPAGKSAPVVKNVETMNGEELEARLRALERQWAVTEPGSPAANHAAGQSHFAAEAQALYNVQMTREEMVELSENVFKLPAEKINKVIALASKSSNSSMEVTPDEEIVLDFESMPNKTLRDIQALMRQTLSKNKKGQVDIGPNSDVLQMDHTRVIEEMEKIKTLQKGRAEEKSDSGKDTDKVKKKRSFYEDSDSSSDSDESDGSESDDEGSSSGESESSGDESGSDFIRKSRERNLAHQQAMQAAGTPLPSPAYQGGVG